MSSQSAVTVRKKQRRRGEQHLLRALQHALVEAALHQEGAGEHEDRVGHDEGEPDQHLLAVRTDEAAQPEGLVLVRFRGDVDVGLVVGRRQRFDGGDELGRDLQRAGRRVPHAATAAGTHAHAPPGAHSEARARRRRTPARR